MTRRSGAPHLIELPLGPARTVNCVLLEGDPLTLVDTGIRDEASLAALESALRHRGYGIADLEQIVVTHPHHDHFGAAAELVRSSGARLLADNPSVLAGFPGSFRPNVAFRTELFAGSGVPQELLSKWGNWEETLASVAEPAEAEVITPGSTVRMGGADWETVATPGHAITSLCFFEPSSGALISGDVLLGNGGSNVTCHTVSRPGRWLLEILDALERLAALGPRTAYPGHGGLIDDAPTTIRSRIDRARLRLEEVAALIVREPRSGYELAQALYPSGIATSSMGLCQALGYGEALLADGRVELRHDDGVERYAPTPV